MDFFVRASSYINAMRIISEMYQLPAFPIVKKSPNGLDEQIIDKKSNFILRAHAPQHFLYIPGREVTAEATLQVAGDTPILELGDFEGLTLVGLRRVIPAHHRLRKIPKHFVIDSEKLLQDMFGCIICSSALYPCVQVFVTV
jgi:hypothetical protein